MGLFFLTKAHAVRPATDSCRQRAARLSRPYHEALATSIQSTSSASASLLECWERLVRVKNPWRGWFPIRKRGSLPLAAWACLGSTPTFGVLGLGSTLFVSRCIESRPFRRRERQRLVLLPLSSLSRPSSLPSSGTSRRGQSLPRPSSVCSSLHSLWSTLFISFQCGDHGPDGEHGICQIPG